MIDLATYLCGLGAGIIVGVALTSIIFRRTSREGSAARRENAQLARLLDNLQRAELSYCQAVVDRGDDDDVTHAAWHGLRRAGTAARGFLYRRSHSNANGRVYGWVSR